MWKRLFKILSSALLSFSVIINGEYSGRAVLRNCHVTINVSSWSIEGSCYVSSTSHQFKCYWIREQKLSKDVMPFTFNKQVNGDKDTGLCSFRSPVLKQKGKYRYYIFSEPQPTNPYSFDMLINGTDNEEIIESVFWEENGVKFGKFTCNASSYFPDVRYMWSVPCQSESLTDSTSVCTTSFKDQRTEVTCIAVYSSGGFADDEDYSKRIFLIIVLTGGGLGVLGILLFSVGIAVYLKRRKVSQTTPEVNNHADQADPIDETVSKRSSASMPDAQQGADNYENMDNETVDQETAITSKNPTSTPLTKTILFSQMNAVGRPMTYL